MKYILSISTLMFLSSLAAQNVNLEWAKNFGSDNSDVGSAIVADGNGYVYTTGMFQGTTDFDPGPGRYDLTSAGGGDVFITKADASGNLVWAKNLGGISTENSNAIAIDAIGNVYTTGTLRGAADFDPGPGTHYLTSAGDLDVFISKLDASGNFVWARRLGSALFDYSVGISLDALGNVYTTGEFQGTVDFDPGSGIHNLTTVGNLDIFISKLDPSGNFVWAKNMGSVLDDFSSSIKVDASGNVYTTGNFQSTADFDPGPGIYNLTTTIAVSAIFVSKLNASGNFVWAKSMNGPDGANGYSITVDGSGNVYTTGRFSGAIDFDPAAGVFNLVSAGVADIFVSKLNASGNFLWAKQMGGAAEDFGNSIAVDGSGNVYTTGEFEGSSDFAPGPAVQILTSAGSEDIFISKLDASGNFVWAKNVGGSSNDAGKSVAVDFSGNVYATGYFQDIADFDPDAPVFSLTSFGSTDAFIIKLSQPLADLEIRKTIDKTSVAIGGSVTFKITLSNKGPKAATGIRVLDMLPPGLDFKRATASTGIYNNITGIWSVGALSNGKKGILTIVATTSRAGELINTAELMAGDQSDPDSSPGNGVPTEDDQSSVSLNVRDRLADLQLKKVANRLFLTAGESLIYKITLSNRGPDAASGIRVTDIAPTGMIFRQVTTSAGAYNSNTGIWSVNALKSGREATLTIVAMAMHAGIITNTAEVTASRQRDPDSSPGNGVATEDDQSSISVRVSDVKGPKLVQKGNQNKAVSHNNPEDKPTKFKLYPNFPNPFYSSTVISFEMAKQSKTQLNIYNSEGKMVKQLLRRVMPAGKHNLTWQPGSLSPGIYYVQLTAGGYTQSQPILFLK